MKKLFSIIASLMFFTNVFAQVREVPMKAVGNQIDLQAGIQWDTNVPKECFCCDANVYNLPTNPPIDGPQSVNCGTAAVFKTIACKGAELLWTVSPAISGTSGDNTNVFTIPATAPAGSYTITLTFRCGKKVYKNTIKFVITEVKNCTSDFNFTQVKNSDGSITISAVPVMQVPGQEHWWGLQYNGAFPNCNQCASIPFAQFNGTSGGVWGGHIDASGVLTPYMGTGITTGSTPYGISYSGFTVNKCVRFTHYVKCCGVLKRTTYCFEITGAVNKVIQNPNGDNKIVDEIGN